jgi:hypothetical protein
MNSIKLFNVLLLGGILALTSGCDSSYHSYDGRSGFKFEPLSIDTYVLEYQGNTQSTKQDVEVMWHHAAREICRGAGYQHVLTDIETQKDSIGTGNELVPKPTTRHRLEGEITCLAPNIAVKRQEGKLFSDHLTTNDLISRSTTN